MGGDLIKGMRQLEFKNVVIDMHSKKTTWNDLKVPEEIQAELEDLKMTKPSIIQAAAVRRICDSQENFLFQAINGSGKTLSFGLPSIMKVDRGNPAPQVLIIANTRELIRQVQQVISRVSRRTGITSVVGDVDTPREGAQIIVTVPQWVTNRIGKKKPLDLSHLKMIVYDEADEIFLQTHNQENIAKLNEFLKTKLNMEVMPQNVLFSATYPEDVIESINKFLPSYNPFLIPVEALKLKGVQMYRIQVEEVQKINFIKDIYLEFEASQTMIFVNRKLDG